jgi:hypothetical protein
MCDLEKFIEETIKNPIALYDFSWHFKPQVFYVIENDSKKIRIAFIDKAFPSYESIMLLKKNLFLTGNTIIVSKEYYDDEIKPPLI